MANEEGQIEFITGEVKGLEKTATEAFDLPAGSKVKAELGEVELDVTVPVGKRWVGKMVLFVREDDA